MGFFRALIERWIIPAGTEGKERSAAQQAKVDEQTAHLALYQFDGCPYCMKVERAMQRLGLNIEFRDVIRDEAAGRELIKGGGRTTVPCLRITHEDGHVQWMYESEDIVSYLEKRFS